MGRLGLRLGSGPHVVGRLGSGSRVEAGVFSVGGLFPGGVISCRILVVVGLHFQLTGVTTELACKI